MKSQTPGNYLSLIKFSHTVFALPFALTGFFLAVYKYNNSLDLNKLGLVVTCMVFARSSAMAFNRYLDRHIDAKNERTKAREIPSGIVKPKNALVFTIVTAGAFVVASYFINELCFFLSPIALLVILGYSYTKRFTKWCHLVLGLGLSLAPIGAFIAVHDGFELAPIILSLAVLFWVGGFDIIYALQDAAFDKEQKLFSIPAVLGAKKALFFSRILHVLCAICIWFFLKQIGFNVWSVLAGCIFTLMLINQHRLVKPNDLSKVNLAFFTANGIASIAFFVFMLLGFLLNQS